MTLMNARHDASYKHLFSSPKVVRRVRTIFDVGAPRSASDGVLRHPEFPGKTPHRQVRALDI